MRLFRRSHLALLLEEPAADLLTRRIQRFAGFVQAGAPIPALTFKVNGDEQLANRYDLEDPHAPEGLRYAAFWNFHRELDGLCRPHERLVFEVLSGRRRIGRRIFRRLEPDDRSARPLVVFLHIPKTAGTSLRTAIERQSAIRLLSLYYDRAYLSPSGCRSFAETAFDDLDVVFGHFPFGLHRLTRRRCEYMTMVRHPAELLRSYYLFMKYNPASPDFEKYETIEDAVSQSIRPAYDNAITRYISGVSTGEAVRREDYQVALRNLKRFAYVGTSETMSESTKIIGDRLGVPLADLTLNVTPGSAEAGDLDREWLMKTFSEQLRYDLLLYEHALRDFAGGARPVT